MRSRLAVAALLLAIATAACSKTLDTKGLEPTLARQLEAAYDLTGVTVSCPTGIKAKAGSTFECTAALPQGGTLTLRVTQDDANGKVTWRTVGASTPTPSP